MERTIYNDTASPSDIAVWAAEQAAESLPTGFSMKIGGDKEIEERLKIVKYRHRLRAYIKLPKLLMKWRWFRNIVYSVADKKATEMYAELQAECLFIENDNEDVVLVYPQRILDYLNNFEERYVPIKRIVKDLMMHEARHAHQFKALRALNINPSMALTYEAMYFKYGEGPMERDAFYLQYTGVEERPVHEVAAEVKRLLTKKGWI